MPRSNIRTVCCLIKTFLKRKGAKTPLNLVLYSAQVLSSCRLTYSVVKVRIEIKPARGLYFFYVLTRIYLKVKDILFF